MDGQPVLVPISEEDRFKYRPEEIIKRFAFDILEQTKVAVTPGIDFGANFEGYIRFSYANSLDKEGLERLERFLAQLR